MANEQNLVKGEDRHKLTDEEASRGGKASGEARARKRDLRKALEALLEKNYLADNGVKYSGSEVLAMSLYNKAKKGDVKAFEVLRDTVGQKPVEKVMVAEVDQSVIDEVEAAVFESNTKTAND